MHRFEVNADEDERHDWLRQSYTRRCLEKLLKEQTKALTKLLGLSEVSTDTKVVQAYSDYMCLSAMGEFFSMERIKKK